MKPPANMQLSVHIAAKFAYSNPPASMEEEILRKQLDIQVSSFAEKLQQGVQLILLEMMDEKIS